MGRERTATPNSSGSGSVCRYWPKMSVSASLSSGHPLLRTSPPLPPPLPISISKVECVGSFGRGLGISKNVHKWPGFLLDTQRLCGQSRRLAGGYQLSSSPLSGEAESFLLSATNMSLFERLNLAWKIIFPSPAQKKNSNARIAKQRLKMILYSDRCAVSDEAKRKIVNNIVHALSEFVEIEEQDKVQLSVTTDADLGTVYSVTVPIRRVKPEYQDTEEAGSITNIEYIDRGETSGSVDVRFDFFIPD